MKSPTRLSKKTSTAWSYAGSRIKFETTLQTYISKCEFKNGHISRFCLIQVISSGKFFSAEEVDLSFNSETKEHPQISNTSFWKRDWKYFSTNVRIHEEMNPLHRSPATSVFMRWRIKSREKEPKQSEITWKQSEPVTSISKIEKRRQFVRALFDMTPSTAMKFRPSFFWKWRFFDQNQQRRAFWKNSSGIVHIIMPVQILFFSRS